MPCQTLRPILTPCPGAVLKAIGSPGPSARLLPRRETDVRKRNERLAAERMALDHVEFKRQRIGLAAQQADHRAGLVARRLDLGKIVIAHAFARIDREAVRALGFENLAEGSEGLAGEWSDLDRLLCAVLLSSAACR